MWLALQQLPRQDDPLPEDLREAEALSDRDQALRWIHFPADQHELEVARERLKFDELFTLELGVAFRRQRLEAERTGVAHAASGPLDRGAARRDCRSSRPTRSVRAMAEVDRRMEAPQPMNLLLQGDVGAGKTLVALHACLIAIQSGHQAAIMAPTEVLAGQHLRSVGALLERDRRRAAVRRHGVARTTEQESLFARRRAPRPTLTYALLSGSVTGADRARVLAGAADGSLDLLIGTHALVQEAVDVRRSQPRRSSMSSTGSGCTSGWR